MADIFIMGHGNWDTTGAPKPFVTVPAATSVVFYTPMGRFIQAHQTVDILRGNGNKLPVNSEIGPFKQCPNLTLSDGLFPAEVKALLQTGVRYALVSQDTTIEQLLEKYAGNRLHWLACMPRLGGNEFRRAQLNDPIVAGVPIAVMSGAIDARQRAETLGAVATLTKPIDLDVLIEVVRRYCA